MLGSLSAVSMFSYELISPPYNWVALGSGVGLVAALAASKLRSGKRPKLGLPGQLPGLPKGKRVRYNPSRLNAVEKQRRLHSYDRAMSELVSGRGHRSRAEILAEMRVMLYELFPDLKLWTGDTRLRGYMLMREIRRGMDDPACQKTCLELLLMVLSRGGSSAVEAARPMFGDKIAEMYRKPEHNTERFVPRLMLLLNNYDPRQVENIAKEAIHGWDDGRFANSGEFLGLEALRGSPSRQGLKEILGAEIASAGVEGDYSALDRAVELYHELK